MPVVTIGLVDLRGNQTDEAMESDSLVNRAVLDAPVLPVKFVPSSAVFSDGFQPSRPRAKRKHNRIYERSSVGPTDDLGGADDFSSVSGNTGNCAINDGVASGNAAGSDNSSGEAVYGCIASGNSVNNNINSGDTGNSCVVSHNSTSINDNSTDNNNSCVANDNSRSSNVNSSKDRISVSNNINSSDTGRNQMRPYTTVNMMD